MGRDVQYEEDSENQRKARFSPLPIPATRVPRIGRMKRHNYPNMRSWMDAFLSSQTVDIAGGTSL